jgi:hypothetical protein
MFTINGSLNWQASNFGDLFSPDSTAGFIRPGLNWNILNYGRIVNNVKVQDVRFQQALLTYLQTVLDANREAEDGIVDFLRLRERAEELAKTVEAAAESVSLAQLHYQQGWIDFDRVNNLQRDLANQQDALVAAEADVALALIRIYRALGGGWQLRCADASAGGARAAAGPAHADPAAIGQGPGSDRRNGGAEQIPPSVGRPLDRPTPLGRRMLTSLLGGQAGLCQIPRFRRKADPPDKIIRKMLARRLRRVRNLLEFDIVMKPLG